MGHTLSGRSNRRGVTLVELLVVMVISMILIAGIYRMFTGQLKIFSTEDEVASLQQQARMAEELLLYTIQQTGGGTPEGDKGIDMQGLPVLAAGDHYLVVQYDDPNYTESPHVIRSNEIVIFAVSNESGAKTEDITFKAYYDKNENGKIDRASEGFDIEVPLTLRGAPYNLYRMTLNNDGSVNRSLVAQNVDNFILRYFDNDGAQIPYDPDTKIPDEMPYVLQTKPVAPAEGLPDIRFIQMELVLRTKNSDPSYTAEFKVDADSHMAKSVATYNNQGVPADSKTFADGYRRRSYVTKMVPRNLPAMPCGKLNMQSNPAKCPNAATVTASAQDRYGDALNGKTIKFTFPGGSKPTIGPFFGGGASEYSTTLSASGEASATIDYRGTSNTIVVAAEIQNVDCSPGGPSSFTLSDAVGVRFDPGDSAWITVMDPQITGKTVTTAAEPLQSCGADTAYTEIKTYDECGNGVKPKTNEYQLGLYSTAAMPSATYGTFAEGNPVAIEVSPKTLTINRPTAAPATQLGTGYYSLNINEAVARPVWLKKVYLGNLPGPWGTGPSVELPGPFLREAIVAPWPPSSIEYPKAGTADTISAFSDKDCPTTAAPAPVLFKVFDCLNTPVYNLTEPAGAAAVAKPTAVLTRANLPDDPSAGTVAGITVSGASPNLTYESMIGGTTGDYSLSWVPPSCLVPANYDDANPGRPLVTLSGYGSNFTSAPVIKTCSDCSVTITNRIDNSTNPATITLCEGIGQVTLGICNVNSATADGIILKLTSSTGSTPYWVNLDRSTPSGLSDGGKTWTTNSFAEGLNTYYFSIGDSPLGTQISVSVESVKQSAGTPLWSCASQSPLTVANKCVGLKAETAYVDDKGVESGRNEIVVGEGGTMPAICAASANRLYLTLTHCRNTTTLSPSTVKVKILQDGSLYDEEEVTLAAQPNPDGTTLPAKTFANLTALNFIQKDTAGSGNGFLEYPTEGSLQMIIESWESSFDAADKCPENDIVIPFIQPIPMCFPNAITSGSGASWSGNFKIHWGDLVIRGSMDVPSKFIEKSKTGQYDGNSWTGNNYSDRLVDIYIGHTKDGSLGADDGTIVGIPTVGGNLNQPFKDSDNVGNYFTNITYDKITSMIVTLDYDVMKTLAKERRSYWYTVSGSTIRNPATGLTADIEIVLNTPPNQYYAGDFIFIDTFGTPNGTDVTEPHIGNDLAKPLADGGYIQGLADADLAQLPSFTITGNYHAAGIIYIAGSLTLGGGGSGKTISDAQAPPNEDTRYDYINKTDATITDENELPIGPKPTAPVSTFSLSKMQANGAIYLIGKFGAQGGPAIYGSVSAERGYTSGGTPEVWYNYRLNQSGYLGNSLCVKCCGIKLNPSTKRIGNGSSAAIVATGNAGTITWDIDDPSIASFTVSGNTATVTGLSPGTTKLWAVDSNNCAVQTTITVFNDCTGYTMNPNVINDLKVGGSSKTVAVEKAGDAFEGGNFTWTNNNAVAVQMTPPALATGPQLATLTALDCGTATITAVDNTVPKVCTGTYVSTIFTVTDLDIVSAINTSGKIVDVTLTGGISGTTVVTATNTDGTAISPAPDVTYPYLGDANKAHIVFSADGRYLVKASMPTAPGCGTKSVSVDVGCVPPTPTVAIDQPKNGTTYYTSADTPTGYAHVGTQVLNFKATPSGSGALGFEYVAMSANLPTALSVNDLNSPYCGFAIGDTPTCSTMRDVASIATGNYIFRATARTNKDACNTFYDSPEATSTITVSLCNTHFDEPYTGTATTNFPAGTSTTYWNAHTTSANNAAGFPTAKYGAGGSSLDLAAKNSSNKTTATFSPLKQVAGVTDLTLAHDWVISAKVNVSSTTPADAAYTAQGAGLRLAFSSVTPLATAEAANYVTFVLFANNANRKPVVKWRNGAGDTGTYTSGLTFAGQQTLKIEYSAFNKELKFYVGNTLIRTQSVLNWATASYIYSGPYTYIGGVSNRTVTGNFDDFHINCLNPLPAP